MFGYEDRRTPKERERDLAHVEKQAQNRVLARSFLDALRVRLEQDQGIQLGLVSNGLGFLDDPSLLIESDGVTYRLEVKVDHE